MTIKTSTQAASTDGNRPRTHRLITLGTGSRVSAPWRAGAARKPGGTGTPHLRCCQDFGSLCIGNGRKREPIPLVYNTGGKTRGRRLPVYSLTSLAHQAELWVAAIHQSGAVPGGEHTRGEEKIDGASQRLSNEGIRERIRQSLSAPPPQRDGGPGSLPRPPWAAAVWLFSSR